MSSSPAIQVRQLAKRYGPLEAVRDVSFDVQAGEIFGLLGRNGAGKTTTLECLLGLRTPDCGSLAVNGVDMRARPAAAKALIGAQLQAAALPDKLTPREALQYFGRFHRDATAAEELLRAFALEAKADARFDTLSGGQQQRLFLALAFVHRPKVVVLDEPTAGLDPTARREWHEVLRGARGAGVAILLSTHDLTEAMQLCDRVGILHEGRIVAAGTPAELVARGGGRPRLIVQPTRHVPATDIAREPGVVAAANDGPRLVLTCSDPTAALQAVTRQMAQTGNPLTDVRLEQPTLEDVFLELTGAPWTREDAS